MLQRNSQISIVKDVINVTRDENGITSMSIYDFLLNEDSLELKISFLFAVR